MIGDVNAFNQRQSGGGILGAENRFFSYLNDNQVNTMVSMIAQAGPRWEGSVPLNCGGANDGLIEIYETVLNRGIDLSID